MEGEAVARRADRRLTASGGGAFGGPWPVPWGLDAGVVPVEGEAVARREDGCRAASGVGAFGGRWGPELFRLKGKQ